MTQEPAGFDAQRIGRWIERRFGISDFDVEVMSVGRSNLTFTITVDGRPRWVLRRPPLGHEGGSAHNVAREGRIMAALSDSAVPVPTVLDIVDDPEVLDVPFVFMDHCPGSRSTLPLTGRRSRRRTDATVPSAWSTHWRPSTLSTSTRSACPICDDPADSSNGSCDAGWAGRGDRHARDPEPSTRSTMSLLEAMPDPAGPRWESRTETSNRTT
jgi:hypothetical protein